MQGEKRTDKEAKGKQSSTASFRGGDPLLEAGLGGEVASNLSREELTKSLIKAIKSGDLKRVKEILSGEVKPILNEMVDGLSPALIYAVDINRPDIAKALIDAGADVDVYDEATGYTPLIHALYKYESEGDDVFLEMMEFLLENGADPDLCDDDFERPPLDHAIDYGLVGVVRVLLKYGAEITDEIYELATMSDSEEIVEMIEEVLFGQE